MTNQSYIQVDASQQPPQCESFRMSQNRPVLGLVIPTLCEVENLPETLRRLRCALDQTGISYEILIVDDDSRDGTTELISGLARKDERIRLLVRRNARGLSGAILHGWQHSHAAILGAMDADGQHPPELLPDLLAAIVGGPVLDSRSDNAVDLVVGSRFAPGSLRNGWNPLRIFMSTLAIWVARPLQPVHLRVADPLSGFFLVRRACVENINFQPTGFKLLLEVLHRGRIRAAKEFPFAFGRRLAGTSKVSLRVVCDYLRLLARLYARRYRGGAEVSRRSQRRWRLCGRRAVETEQ